MIDQRSDDIVSLRKKSLFLLFQHGYSWHYCNPALFTDVQQNSRAEKAETLNQPLPQTRIIQCLFIPRRGKIRQPFQFSLSEGYNNE